MSDPGSEHDPEVGDHPTRDPEENDERSGDLPEGAVEEAERLTRLARKAEDEREREAYEDDRAELLADHGFTGRVRRDDGDETLVLYPAEWVADGVIDPDRIDEVDRAVEVPLSGTGDPDTWGAVDEHNRRIARQVREDHGEVHGDNAEAFAAFMSNHYAKPVEKATAGELREFLGEYFPRNAWPTDDQRAAVGRSVGLVFEAVDEPVPEI